MWQAEGRVGEENGLLFETTKWEVLEEREKRLIQRQWLILSATEEVWGCSQIAVGRGWRGNHCFPVLEVPRTMTIIHKGKCVCVRRSVPLLSVLKPGV